MPNFFALSLSLEVGIIAAFVAATLTLRRPVVRAWALYWGVRMTSGAVAASVLAATPQHPLAHPRLSALAVSWLTGTSLFCLLRAGWQQFHPGPEWRTAWRAAVVLLLPFLAFPLTVPSTTATAADFGWYALYARAGGWPTDLLLLAVTVSYRHRTDRVAAAFLTAGFALCVLRDLASAVFVVPRLGTSAVMASPPFLNVVQLLAMVVVALGGLFAVLAEERRALQRLAAEVERTRTYETLGRMAGGVAHDFNNLLQVIGLSISGAAERGGSFVLGQSEVRAIDEAVDQGRDMVGTLMAFARQDAAAAAVPFDLHALIRAHEVQLRKLMDAEQTLEVALADGACPLHGDPRGMQRLLNNLVANARDAMREGGRITIRTALHREWREIAGGGVRDGAAPHVSLTVSDEGTGIPAEALPRIFDPFFTTKTAGRGTGLGLALAQAFVRGAGGEIRVRDSTPRGTTFEIVLPLAA